VIFCFYLRTRHSLNSHRSDSKSRFRLGKLTVSQLVKKFATLSNNLKFMKLYLKPDTSHCLSHIEDSLYYYLDIHFNIIQSPFLCALITFHLPNPMSISHSLHRPKGSVPVRCFVEYSVTLYALLETRQPTKWRTPLIGCPLLFAQYINS